MRVVATNAGKFPFGIGKILDPLERMTFTANSSRDMGRSLNGIVTLQTQVVDLHVQLTRIVASMGIVAQIAATNPNRTMDELVIGKFLELFEVALIT